MASAAAESDCSCTNISIMQLFHELKQKFPAVPDRVVSECIRQNFHDRETCEAILSRENLSYLLHSYPPSLKMSSSGSCEPESPLSSRLHALTFCEKCTAERSSVSLLGGHSHGNISTSQTSNISAAEFLQEGTAQYAAGSHPHFMTTGSLQAETYGDTQPSQAYSVLKRCDNKWLHNPADNNINNSHVSYQGDVSSRSNFIQLESSVNSDVSHSQQYSACGVHNSHLFSSQTESLPNTYSCQSGVNEQEQVRQSTTVACGTVLPLPFHKACNRPSSLNISQGRYHHHSSHSAPVISDNFEPFHSSDNHPNSSCEKPGVGNNSSPHQHIGQSCKQNELPTNNSKSYSPGSGVPGVLQEDASLYGGDRTVVNSYQVNVNCSLQHNGTGSTVNVSGSSTCTMTETPKPHQRARSTIQFQPMPHYAGQNSWATSGGSAHPPASTFVLPPQQPRSYTSVNLTLRPPSSERQAPIDIHSGGSSLMYSTSSYDPRQGVQSKLQICIGPGGVGSVSAMRTQTHEPGWTPQVRPQTHFVPTCEPSSGEDSAPETSRPLSPLPESSSESTISTESTLEDQTQTINIKHLHSATQVLLGQQLEHKNRLQLELQREKKKLHAMQQNVRLMEKDLEQRQLAKSKAIPAVTTKQKVQRLTLEIRKLTEECEKMTHEVDNFSDARVPLGETDEEFYKNIYTGQRGNVGTFRSHQEVPRNRPEPQRQAPPLPPESDPREGLSWTCSECTFRNYWALEYCEQCEMPRIMLGTDSSSLNSCYRHPEPTSCKLYPTSPLTAIPLMRSSSPPKLN